MNFTPFWSQLVLYLLYSAIVRSLLGVFKRISADVIIVQRAAWTSKTRDLMRINTGSDLVGYNL